MDARSPAAVTSGAMGLELSERGQASALDPFGFNLRLLGRFSLTTSTSSLCLGTSAQRLLALGDGPVSRAQAAGVLWPEVQGCRANANLRSALWRLQRSCPLAIHASFQELSLPSNVTIALHIASATARRLLDRSITLGPDELSSSLRCNLSEDLLPDWSEDEWLTAEREPFRQLRLHALEALCERLFSAGSYGAAVDTALAAVRSDPFRESARYVLVRTYLAEGNHREALDEYESFHRLLDDELGVEPSPDFRRLVFAGAEPRQAVQASRSRQLSTSPSPLAAMPLL